MEKYYKISVEETKATRIKATADQLVKREGIQGYAMMWLNLTNNQKTYKNNILKIYNDYDNGIYVVCNAEEKNVNATIDYLQQLGLLIEDKEEVIIVTPDEIFSDDDLDVELVGW